MNTRVMAAARSVSRPFARYVCLRMVFNGGSMKGQIGTAAKGIQALGIILALSSVPTAVYAWGDEGHEIVALIAAHYLEPAVLTKVNNMLATDTTNLTPSRKMDIEATWADKFRESSQEH